MEFTKERFLKIQSWSETYGPGSNVVLPAEEAAELARIALAAMDSEPVILYRERNPYNGLTTGWQELTENEFSFLKENAGENAEFVTLYRHAQPAPVVPDDVRQALCKMDDEIIAELDAEESARRAAMLNGEMKTIEPTPTAALDDLLSMAASAIEDLLEHTDPNTSYYSGVWADVPGKLRAAMLQADPVTTANKLGNSPVIPDGSEDTKRLNWLDAQNKRLNEYYGTSYGWKFDANFQRNAMMLNDSNYPVMTVRQAIDEAIAAAPQEVKGE